MGGWPSYCFTSSNTCSSDLSELQRVLGGKSQSAEPGRTFCPYNYDGMVLPFLRWAEADGVQRFEALDVSRLRVYRAELSKAFPVGRGGSNSVPLGLLHPSHLAQHGEVGDRPLCGCR